MKTNAYRLLLADDHSLFRLGLSRVLSERADLEVVAEAKDGLELLEVLKRTHPQMVLLDISMPHLRGIEAIPEIRRTNPKVKILVLTMHKDLDYMTQAMAAGAHGYLLKDDAEKDLFLAVDTVRKGEMYLSPLLARELGRDWARSCRGSSPAQGNVILTVRERQVLKLVAEGKSSKAIGDLLFISSRTVERHRANILEKLHLRNTADLVRYAVQKTIC